MRDEFEGWGIQTIHAIAGRAAQVAFLAAHPFCDWPCDWLDAVEGIAR